MQKILTIAKREYQALVRTKAFIISLVMMPVFALGGIFIQTYMAGRTDTSEKKIVVLDATGKFYEPLVALAAMHNQGIVDSKTGAKTGPTIVLEKGPKGQVTDDVRLELSELIRQNQLFAFVEIDAGALQSHADLATLAQGQFPFGVSSDDDDSDAAVGTSPTQDDKSPSDKKSPNDQKSKTSDAKAKSESGVKIYTESMSFGDISRWLKQSINQVAFAVRLEQAGLNPAVVAGAIAPVDIREMGLYSKSSGGEVRKGENADRGITFMLPFGLMMLMFMSVMVVCQPMISSVLEEKQQRIAEMLLGSASPFQIMMGKLVGNVAVALTIVAIYVTGGYLVAAHFGYADLLPMWLLGWFVAFEILAVTLYGSLFLAVGAACNELKEAQSLLTPMMILLVMPMMVWFNVIQEPLSPLSQWLSLVPPATPMIMLMRLAASPMVPLWQPVLGIVLVLATTVLAIFAGGRVFRIGLLMQGKAPKMTELARWVARG
jgi:ABC-2 type transport system permease protein